MGVQLHTLICNGFVQAGVINPVLDNTIFLRFNYL